MIKAQQRGTFSTRPLSLPNCYPAPAECATAQNERKRGIAHSEFPYLQTSAGLAGRTAGTSVRLPSVPGLTTRLMYGQRFGQEYLRWPPFQSRTTTAQFVRSQ